jgi:hypothetical protein
VKHPHAELIKAWADGAVIQQYKPHLDEWHDISPYPAWDERLTYRIKPKPKPDVVKHIYVMNSIDGVLLCEGFHEIPNIKLTFDGQTGELKSAEVLK